VQLHHFFNDQLGVTGADDLAGRRAVEHVNRAERTRARATPAGQDGRDASAQHGGITVAAIGIGQVVEVMDEVTERIGHGLRPVVERDAFDGSPVAAGPENVR